ncbi:MAG: hypothetical protein U0994_05435 [Gemmatimonadales bacterium]|nr:hypothetical protein [Gemmatimonadales bacterium]
MTYENAVSKSSLLVVALGLLALVAVPKNELRAAESQGGCVSCGNVCPSDLETFCGTHCPTLNNGTCETTQCKGMDGDFYPVKIVCRF